MFIDVHCHLNDDKLKDDLSRIVSEFKAAGVGRVINVGCDAESSACAFKQAQEFPEIYFAAGLHPQELKDKDISEIYEIEKLCKDEKCVAVGEIGLDYYWDKTYCDKQKEFFLAQTELAYSLKLPVNIHVREAMGDAVKLIKDNRDKFGYGGVMHCFSGSRETAKELLDMGLYISFGGSVTFKNSRVAKEVAAFVPKDRLLTETDSPYLAPEPLRGTVNSPENIPIIAAKLAEIRGKSVEDIEIATEENARRLFYGLK